MSASSREFAPSLEFGIAAVCLGSIALLLFFLPILSIPISLCGLAAGVGGLIRGRFAAAAGLRWSLIGCALCGAVLGLECILANAPTGELPGRALPIQTWSPPDRPYVSPPSSPSPSGRGPG